METAALPFIPYGRQDISEADIQAVVDVLRSDWLTQGPAIETFETAMASYCGVRYAVAVSNATAALHLACLALGLKAGQRVWTSPITFVASANCARYCDADVDFIDIDPKTYNISIPILTEKLLEAELKGVLPDIVIPVHFSGQSVDMVALHQLSLRFGFRIIEDAAHAIGGRYKERPIGSCDYSDMAIFSFHPVKIITTGEGGLITTNEPELYQRLLQYRSHGITRNQKDFQKTADGPWYYEQLDLGFNYRITDIQAALGHSQMTRLDSFIRKRHELVAAYNGLLADLPVVLPWQHPDAYSSFHLYVICLPQATKAQKLAVFEALRAENIGVNVHYIPVHLQPYYQNLGFQPGDYPNAERYYTEAITLPLHVNLTLADQERVVSALRLAMAEQMGLV